MAHDVVKDAVMAAYQSNDFAAFGPEDMIPDFIVFLKHIRDHGPDSVMKGKPHLFGGYYWKIIAAFLNHLISRLEAQEQTNE